MVVVVGFVVVFVVLGFRCGCGVRSCVCVCGGMVSLSLWLWLLVTWLRVLRSCVVVVVVFGRD